MITICRWYHDDCTIGRLTLAGHTFQCFTLELPWLLNEINISCIPEGIYRAKRRSGSKNGYTIELKDVPDRTYIQIHSGNYTRQILGCFLVGNSVKWLDDDSIPDVTNSVITMRRLLELLPTEFDIEILS